MHFFRIMHGIIAWCQEGLPFTIDDQNIVVVAAGTVAQAIVDILQANNIIGDRAFVIAAAMQGDPDLILFAIDLFLGRFYLFSAITQYTRLVTSYLHFAAHNHLIVISPSIRILLI